MRCNKQKTHFLVNESYSESFQRDLLFRLKLWKTEDLVPALRERYRKGFEGLVLRRCYESIKGMIAQLVLLRLDFMLLPGKLTVSDA